MDPDESSDEGLIRDGSVNMNEAIIKGKWNQLKGSVKNNWRELTDEDLDVGEGDAMVLSGIIQERYGITKEEADQEVREFGRI